VGFDNSGVGEEIMILGRKVIVARLGHKLTHFNFV
jgi:hypothetical protein